MKALTLLLFLITFTISNAQNTFLDYAVTSSNDTIYGVIKKEKLYVLNQVNKEPKILDLTEAKSIRQNDVVYHKTDQTIDKDASIVIKKFNSHFIASEKRQDDFILNKANDTVFGTLKTPFFGTKYIKKQNTKVKLTKAKTISYRYSNTIFDLKTLGTELVSRKRNVFLKRLIKGKVNLYQYRVLKTDVGTVSPENFYMIEKDAKLHLISNTNYKQTLIDLFINNTPLVDLIDDGTYTLENIYLIVKRYNSIF